MSDTFEGRARILDMNGLLVDIGKAALHREERESGGWGGTIRLYVNASLAAKAIEAFLDLENGNRAEALVGPRVGDLIDGELITVRVIGLSEPVPF